MMIGSNLAFTKKNEAQESSTSIDHQTLSPQHDGGHYNDNEISNHTTTTHAMQCEGRGCIEESTNLAQILGPLTSLLGIFIFLWWLRRKRRIIVPIPNALPVIPEEEKRKNQVDLENRNWLMQNLEGCSMVVKEEAYQHTSSDSTVCHRDDISETSSSSHSDGDLEGGLSMDLERGPFSSNDVVDINSVADATSGRDSLLLNIPRKNPDPSALPDKCNKNDPYWSLFKTVPNECSICLCSYNIGDKVVWSSNTKCPHVFHEDCIFSWLMPKMESINLKDEPGYVKDLICPCCRREFVVNTSEKRDNEHASRSVEEGEVEFEQQSNEEGVDL